MQKEVFMKYVQVRQAALTECVLQHTATLAHEQHAACFFAAKA